MSGYDKFAAGVVFGALLALAAAYSNKAQAADAWLTATIASYHTRRTVDHNERNWGLGFEYSLSDRWRVSAGDYRNSYYRNTTYAGIMWLPVHEGALRAGVMVGGATGYSRTVATIIVPTIAFEGKTFGANIGIMPALDKRVVNVIGLQLKARF